MPDAPTEMESVLHADQAGFDSLVRYISTPDV
jgi:hypothetical protein